MTRAVTSLIPHLGAFIVCSAGMSLTVLAAPPLNKVLGSDRPARSFPAHLDLRLPLERESAAVPVIRTGAAQMWAAPQGGQHNTMSMAVSMAEDRKAGIDDSLRPLGAEMGGSRPNVRTMVEHFHREGLPVARLWENHSALISLGLNGKGKPGLWLTQKTH
jgi:hypothetical protein